MFCAELSIVRLWDVPRSLPSFIVLTFPLSQQSAVSGLLPLLLDPRGRVRPVAGGEVVVVEHVVPQNIVLLLQLVHLLLHTVLQGVTALHLSTVCTPGAGQAPCHSGTRRWAARACGWRGRWPSWRRRTRRPSSWLRGGGGGSSKLIAILQFLKETGRQFSITW